MVLSNKRIRLVLENKYIPLLLIEKSNMMYLLLFREALNMEKFIIKSKITKQWRKFINLPIIVSLWQILPNQLISHLRK
jgi:hypothetical protein